MNFVSCAHAASAVRLRSSNDLSELYTIKGGIIIAIVCVCLFAAFIGTLEVIARIVSNRRISEEPLHRVQLQAIFAWNQLCRYATRLRAELRSKAEELRLREEQIRLREEQIMLWERELAQRSTLQIDADVQLSERLAQFFERSAFAIRARVHELEIEREPFADMATQDEFGGDRQHLY
ncbi:hypothetical protein C8R42DRAFT_714925 [Lentinula raphanica]|nr:hypothetical protein C8R42DRAFT_714925 [Lentinula raphanica]